MKTLPATDLRSNLGTWAVPACRGPALGAMMRQVYPPEEYDKDFCGQRNETTYLDTPSLKLHKARKQGDRYMTLRVRCYTRTETYAFSAKTESEKFRTEIDPKIADLLLSSGLPYADAYELLPANLQARFQELTEDEATVPIVQVQAFRYAVEDDSDRMTLDLDVSTYTGKTMPYGVLEFKSKDKNAQPQFNPVSYKLQPIKLSKFLWATE
jgi:hypothetical protein